MLDFIYHGGSGSNKGERVIKKINEILSSLKKPFALHKTTAPKEATSIAKSLCDNGATDLIAVGGDGTLHEVLNGINPHKVNLGLIPAGSGNDFAESCNIPFKTKEALDIILNGSLKPTDYMDCAGVKGINLIGTGLDVDILKRCQKFKILKGRMQYLASLFISLFKFSNYKFKLVSEDESIEKSALIIAVGNGKQCGGGIKVCPNAKVDDGILNAVLVNEMPRRSLLGALLKLLKGKIDTVKQSEIWLCNHIKAEFDCATTIQIDGELYDNLPFDIKIIPNGINFYRP